MYRRATILIVVVFGLAACAQAPTERLAASANSIHALRVYAWGDADPAVISPASTALVATLNLNGLKATQFVALQRPFEDLNALERTWFKSPAVESASHALVLTRQYQQTGFVRYEAVLWDAGSRKLIWKGTLASAAAIDGSRRQVTPKDAAQRAERLAGDVLRALDRDGLFPLAAKVPHDAQGHEIPPTLIPIQLL